MGGLGPQKEIKQDYIFEASRPLQYQFEANSASPAGDDLSYELPCSCCGPCLPNDQHFCQLL